MSANPAHLSALLALLAALTGCNPSSVDPSSASPTQEHANQHNHAEPSAEVINTVTFVSAGNESITAIYKKNETVTLTLADGTTKTLPIAVSGSGARYAADGFEWWEHQGEATYSVDGKPVFAGKLKK
ncbi:MAG: MliC family protein [Pseudomonadota bacterium]|nr:MliC family protein [Pseudomonadota bacterium]